MPPGKKKTAKKKQKKTKRGRAQDRRLRSKEKHEFGRGAPRKGNPSFRVCYRTVKTGPQRGMRVKRYCRRRGKK